MYDTSCFVKAIKVSGKKELGYICRIRDTYTVKKNSLLQNMMISEKEDSFLLDGLTELRMIWGRLSWTCGELCLLKDSGAKNWLIKSWPSCSFSAVTNKRRNWAFCKTFNAEYMVKNTALIFTRFELTHAFVSRKWKKKEIVL